jgi:hypothetical protein
MEYNKWRWGESNPILALRYKDVHRIVTVFSWVYFSQFGISDGKGALQISPAEIVAEDSPDAVHQYP